MAELQWSNKSVILKGGSTAIISKYGEEDFSDLVDMYASLSEEVLRWTRPPYDEETIKKLSREKNMVLVAKIQDSIIGHCMLDVYQHSTGKGISFLIVNIHQDFQNKGLGTAMIETIVEWARKKGIHRIELSVASEHKIAVHVYEKVGFKIEGVQKEAYYGVDGKYHDKVMMGLIL